MKTVTTMLYSFEELTPKAKEKAIEDVRNDEYYLSWDWHEDIIDDYVTNVLAPEGWNTTPKDIFFSGFWSQGDGASFDGNLDIYDYLNFHCLTKRYPLITKVTENGPFVHGGTHVTNYHYSHERTRRFSLDHDGESALVLDGGLKEKQLPKFNEEFTKLEEDIEDRRLDLCQRLYKELEDTYNSLNSDESIMEHIIANEYEYTADGKLWTGH